MRKILKPKDEFGQDAIVVLIFIATTLIILVLGAMTMRNIVDETVTTVAQEVSANVVKEDVNETVKLISTALIKDPTADIISSFKDSNGTIINVGSVVLNVPETISSATDIYVGGRWNGYWILGVYSSDVSTSNLPEGHWDSVDGLTEVDVNTLPNLAVDEDVVVFYNSVAKTTTVFGE